MGSCASLLGASEPNISSSDRQRGVQEELLGKPVAEERTAGTTAGRTSAAENGKPGGTTPEPGWQVIPDSPPDGAPRLDEGFLGHEDHQEDPEGPMSRRLATAEPAQPAPSASGILGHESVPPILPRVPVQRLCILPPIGQTHRMISSVPLPKRSWDDSEGHDSAGHIHTPDEPLPGGEHDDSGLPRMQRCPSPTPRRSRNPYGDGWHAEENHLMTEATPQEQSGHERRFPPVDARDGYSGSLEDSEDFGDSYAGPTSMAVLKQVIGFGNPQAQFPRAQAAAVDDSQHYQPEKPEAEEIIEYARQLGMDLTRDSDLLWIAEQGLQAPMPPNWRVYCDQGSGCDYYVNEITGVTTWEHPLHENFRGLYLQMSEERERSRIKSQLDDMRQRAWAKGEMRRAAAAQRRAAELHASVESDFSEHNFLDNSFATGLGDSLDTTQSMSYTRKSNLFNETHDSLDTSLSNSRIGGLQLSLIGMTKPPKDGKRGGGLGLELKTHDKIGSKKPAADERKRPTGREVFQWMLNGRS